MDIKLPKKFKIFLLLLVLTLTTAAAHAVPTQVQFNPGSGWITGIDSFQWEDNTNAAIEQDIKIHRGGTTIDTTLFNYFNGNGVTKIDGDQIEIVTHAQTRLVGAPSQTGNFYAAGFDANGLEDGVDSGWEVTMAFTMAEMATYNYIDDGGGAYKDKLTFDTVLSGSFAFFLDDTVDSDHITGVGFTDPAPAFLNGSIDTVSGSFTSAYDTGGALVSSSGNVNISNTITSYINTIIETDPAVAGVVLDGANFNTDIIFGGDSNSAPLFKEILSDGTASIGLVDPLTVTSDNALLLQAQGTSDFSAVPEPTTMVLLGFGLLGLAGITRKRVN